ncbi:hypothetical protein K2X33_14030, partial [bacterium]|nr:hypothetical protein [bacterium]
PPFLPALAAFEWLQMEALMTDRRLPRPTLTAETLAQTAPETLCFALNPSVRLHTSAWNVDKLHSLKAKSSKRTVRLVLYKGPEGLSNVRLTDQEMRLLEFLKSRTEFTAVLGWVEENQFPPEKLQECIRQWTTWGILYGFTSAP